MFVDKHTKDSGHDMIPDGDAKQKEHDEDGPGYAQLQLSSSNEDT